jgi:DNA-binding CsgD family transcriptional regulator
MEALKWTMEGKTAWEVSAILGISERSAVFHLTNSMRKLGAINKHQAALRALQLGLMQ